MPRFRTKQENDTVAWLAGNVSSFGPGNRKLSASPSIRRCCRSTTNRRAGGCSFWEATASSQENPQQTLRLKGCSICVEKSQRSSGLCPHADCGLDEPLLPALEFSTDCCRYVIRNR